MAAAQSVVAAQKLFRVFGSMSAPSEGPQAKSLPSPASACATTGLWLKGQSLALRRWWSLHDMHPAWCAGRRFLVARLTGAARSVCSGRFGRVATKMVPQGRFWPGASDEKRCVRSMGSLGCVECGLGAGLDCGGWHHGLLLPSPKAVPARVVDVVVDRGASHRDGAHPARGVCADCGSSCGDT